MAKKCLIDFTNCMICMISLFTLNVSRPDGGMRVLGPEADNPD